MSGLSILSQAGDPANRVVTGDEIDKDLDLVADVCVIGSGAGGAVLAAELAQAGRSVVMFEEGGHHTKREFDMQEGTMVPLLYQDRGGRATADQSCLILQGRCIGGTTVVNYTTCFRTPDTTLAHWKSRWGVEGLDPATLNPSWEKVEARLGIAEIHLEQVNKNNRVLWDGCEKLGWEKKLLRRNVRNCRHSGYCGMGCAFDAKQAMHVTYVLDALAAGARVHANARVDQIEREGNRITAVHATILDPLTDKPTGRTIRVKSTLTALCGGAVNNPKLLFKSKITDGPVGKKTWFHPLAISVAEMPYRVEAFYGAPQSVASHQFGDRGKGKLGYFMECAPTHPMLTSIGATGIGDDHRERMERLPFISAMYAHFIDGFTEEEQGATVTLTAAGNPKVDYHYTDSFWEAVKDAQKNLARIQLASGAIRAHTLHTEPVEIRSEADLAKIDRAPLGPNKILLATAHLMGGCRMGADPKEAVVRSDLRHHQVENLYIVDGSVFPTGLGVNPSLTIYGLATHAAKGIAAAAS